MDKKHILIFDILRIAAILMVVYHHILASLYKNVPSITFMGDNLGIGKIGVLIFVTISGALLYLTTKEEILTFSNVWSFYYKRFVRLYPSLWISFIIYLILNPRVLEFQTLRNWIVQLSGATVYFIDITNPTTFAQLVNPISYFVGLIIGLYLIYPLLYKASKYYPLTTFLTTIIISTVTVVYYHVNFDTGNPLAFLMFFGLGTYIAKSGLYPKTTIDSKNIIVTMSNLSFYVFLIHGAVFGLWQNNLIKYVGLTLLLASMLNYIDTKIQSKLKMCKLNEKYVRALAIMLIISKIIWFCPIVSVFDPSLQYSL